MLKFHLNKYAGPLKEANAKQPGTQMVCPFSKKGITDNNNDIRAGKEIFKCCYVSKEIYTYV